MHARLHENADVLKVLKNSIIPKLTFWTIQLTGQAPLLFPSLMWTPVQSVVEWILSFVLESLCAVVTNVPGPQGSGLTLAGSEVVSGQCGRGRRAVLSDKTMTLPLT